MFERSAQESENSMEAEGKAPRVIRAFMPGPSRKSARLGKRRRRGGGRVVRPDGGMEGRRVV